MELRSKEFASRIFSNLITRGTRGSLSIHYKLRRTMHSRLCSYLWYNLIDCKWVCSCTFIWFSCHIACCIVYADYSCEDITSLTRVETPTPVLLLWGTHLHVFTSVCMCFSCRIPGGPVWTVPSDRHVAGGLFHHLHDRAVSLCHLHQRGAWCWRSLLYPLLTSISTGQQHQ